MLSYKLYVRDYYEALGTRYLELYLRDSVLGYLGAAEALGGVRGGARVLDVGCGGVGVGGAAFCLARLGSTCALTSPAACLGTPITCQALTWCAQTLPYYPSAWLHRLRPAD